MKRLVRAYQGGIEADSIALHGHVIQCDFKSVDGDAGEFGYQGILHGVFHGKNYAVFKVFQGPDRIDLFHNDRRYGNMTLVLLSIAD